MASEQFKSTFIELCRFAIKILEDVKKQGVPVPVEPSLINLALIQISLQDANTMTHTFIKESLQYWELIYIKDERFLTENAQVLFSELPKEYITGLVDLIGQRHPDGTLVIPPPSREHIWEFVHLLVQHSIRHIHEIRAFKAVVNPDGSVTKKYTVEYFKEVSVKKLVQQWNVGM